MGCCKELPSVNHAIDHLGGVRNIINPRNICAFIPEGDVVSKSPRIGLQTVVFCAGHQGKDLRVWFSGQMDKNMILEGGIIL
jgi:hypothetical protein